MERAIAWVTDCKIEKNVIIQYTFWNPISLHTVYNNMCGSICLHNVVVVLLLFLAHSNTAKKITSRSGLIKLYILTKPQFVYKFKLHSK